MNYVYIVRSTETLGYIGHGLWEECSVSHGVYDTEKKAQDKVKELSKEGIEAWVSKEEVL